MLMTHLPGATVHTEIGMMGVPARRCMRAGRLDIEVSLPNKGRAMPWCLAFWSAIAPKLPPDFKCAIGLKNPSRLLKSLVPEFSLRRLTRLSNNGLSIGR